MRRLLLLLALQLAAPLSVRLARARVARMDGTASMFDETSYEADRLALVANLVKPDDVDDPDLLPETARKTDGFSGADLAHLVACAFDHAALRNSKTLSRADFDAAEAEASTLARDLEDERRTKARYAAAAEKKGKLPDYPRVLATKTYGDYDDVPDT